MSLIVIRKMDNYEILLPVIAGIMLLIASIIASSRFPGRELANDVKGKKTRGHVSINNANYHVSIIINEEKLAIRSFFPSFSIVLSIEQLKLRKVRAFIGTQIEVTSSESGIESTFYSMVISHTLAKKLEKLSNGNFRYQFV